MTMINANLDLTIAFLLLFRHFANLEKIERMEKPIYGHLLAFIFFCAASICVLALIYRVKL